MLADALAQFLVLRKWQRALLIVGQTEDDQAYAAALRRGQALWRATGRGKTWTFDNDQRRSAQADMPLFTQTAEYDVVLVADERGDFGEYLPYQTWYPRPVAGTQGLTPRAGTRPWKPSVRRSCKTLRGPGRALDERPRLRRLDGRAQRRQRGQQAAPGRTTRAAATAAQRAVAAGRLQGPQAQLPPVERRTAPADPAGAAARPGQHLAAGGLPASLQRNGQPGLRQARSDCRYP
jgi:hypothetical protein